MRSGVRQHRSNIASLAPNDLIVEVCLGLQYLDAKLTDWRNVVDIEVISIRRSRIGTAESAPPIPSIAMPSGAIPAPDQLVVLCRASCDVNRPPSSPSLSTAQIDQRVGQEREVVVLGSAHQFDSSVR